MNTSCRSLLVIATVDTGSTSTGSPVSRLPWQSTESFAGTPGNCQTGTAVFPKGSLSASEISCEKGVTSCVPPSNIPGDVQLAMMAIHADCGVVVGSEANEWNPRTQQPAGFPVASIENWKVFG